MYFFNNLNGKNHTDAMSASMDAQSSFLPLQGLDSFVSSTCYNGIGQTESRIIKHYRKHEPRKGLSLARKLAKQNKNDDFAIALMSAGYMSLNRQKEAIKWARHALKLNRNNVIAHEVMARSLNKIKKFADSITHCELALKMDPENLELRRVQAQNFCSLGNYPRAVQIYQSILAKAPNHKSSLEDLCSAAEFLGDRALMKKAATKLVQVDPSHALGYTLLAKHTEFNLTDPNSIRLLEKLMDIFEANESQYEQSHLCTAIANAAESLHQYDLSFQFYSKAAMLKRGDDSSQYSETAAYARRCYSLLDHLAQSPSTSETITPVKHPILIVGMPRSGTSLTEQILASHTKVHGAGELEDLQECFDAAASPESLIKADPLITRQIAHKTSASYIEAITKKFGVNKHITDKMPNNYQFAGVVLAAMPDARLIFTRRDPMASVWSSFKTNFGTDGLSHTRNLSYLVDFYEQSLKFLVKLKEMFGERIYVMEYEKLTESQETETRKLLAYCGLEFEENCLKFHETKRGIKTASSLQVVQPMYKGSSQAWRKFEKHLLPYAEILNELDRKYAIDSL